MWWPFLLCSRVGTSLYNTWLELQNKTLQKKLINKLQQKKRKFWKENFQSLDKWYWIWALMMNGFLKNQVFFSFTPLSKTSRSHLVAHYYYYIQLTLRNKVYFLVMVWWSRFFGRHFDVFWGSSINYVTVNLWYPICGTVETKSSKETLTSFSYQIFFILYNLLILLIQNTVKALS